MCSKSEKITSYESKLKFIKRKIEFLNNSIQFIYERRYNFEVSFNRNKSNVISYWSVRECYMYTYRES